MQSMHVCVYVQKEEEEADKAEWSTGRVGRSGQER